MSLPDAWTDRIFDKLTLVYGHQFLSRWDGIDMTEVKADWGKELSRFQQNPAALEYGLQNLPAGKPPTVLEFRAICNSPQAPAREWQPRLPNYAQTAADQDVELHMERLRKVRRERPDCGGFAWAFALEIKDREQHEKVSPLVRRMYRDALENWNGRRSVKEST